MRRAIVPAQITTVEDRIAGNLSVQQALLLGLPLLLGFCIALLLPPFEQMVGYKFFLIGCITVLSGSLAVRVEDHIIGWWLILLIRYVTRPRYYVYDKNNSYLRAVPEEVSPEESAVTDESKLDKVQIPDAVTLKEKVRLGLLTEDKAMSVRFKVGKKGRLNVHVSQAK